MSVQRVKITATQMLTASTLLVASDVSALLVMREMVLTAEVSYTSHHYLSCHKIS